MNKIFFLTAEKSLGYQLAYWITALLPVILGFGITMILVWYLTKTYKGEDEEDNQPNEKK